MCVFTQLFKTLLGLSMDDLIGGGGGGGGGGGEIGPFGGPR